MALMIAKLCFLLKARNLMIMLKSLGHLLKPVRLSVKIMTTKLLAGERNAAMAPLIKKYASEIQNGFIKGRNFLCNVVGLDAFARFASFPDHHHHFPLIILFLFIVFSMVWRSSQAMLLVRFVFLGGFWGGARGGKKASENWAQALASARMPSGSPVMPRMLWAKGEMYDSRMSGVSRSGSTLTKKACKS